MFGIGNPEYMDNAEFRNSVRSGMAIGFLIGSPVSIHGSINSIRKYSKDKRALTDLIKLDVETEKENYRHGIYYKAHNSGTQQRILGILDNLKGQEYSKDNRVTDEDIDNEIRLAKKSFSIYKYLDKNTNINPIEMQQMAAGLLGASENIRRANNNIQEHEKLIDNLYYNVDDIVSTKDPSFEGLNRVKNRITAITTKLDKIDENKGEALKKVLPYKKYLQVELSKAVKKLESGLEASKIKQKDLALPIDDDVVHFELLNLDNEYQAIENEELYSYLSIPENVDKTVAKERQKKEIQIKEEQKKEDEKVREANNSSAATNVKDSDKNSYTYVGKTKDGNYQFLNKDTRRVETLTPDEVKSRDMVEETTNKSVDKAPTLLTDPQGGEYIYLGKADGKHKVQNLQLGDVELYTEKELGQLSISNPEGLEVKEWIPGSVLDLINDDKEYKKFKDKIDENAKEIDKAVESAKDDKKATTKEELFNTPIDDLDKFVKYYANIELGKLTFAELFGNTTSINQIPVVYNGIIGTISLNFENEVIFETVGGVDKVIGDLSYILPVKDYNLSVLKNFLFNFNISDNGTVLSIDGNLFEISKLSPLNGVKEDENGDPISITLKRADTGKDVTFTSRSVVEEIATYLMLVEEAKNEILGYVKTTDENFVKVNDPKSKYNKQYYVYDRDGEYLVVDPKTKDPINVNTDAYKRIIKVYNKSINELTNAYSDIANELQASNKETKNNIQNAIREIIKGVQPATEEEILDAKSASELQDAKGKETETSKQTNESEVKDLKNILSFEGNSKITVRIEGDTAYVTPDFSIEGHYDDVRSIIYKLLDRLSDNPNVKYIEGGLRRLVESSRTFYVFSRLGDYYAGRYSVTIEQVLNEFKDLKFSNTEIDVIKESILNNKSPYSIVNSRIDSGIKEVSKEEEDLVNDKTEELAEEAIDTEEVITNKETIPEDLPIETTEFESEIDKAYRDAHMDGLLDVATSVAWTANDDPVFNDYISDSKLRVNGFYGEIRIDFDYDDFWDKHEGLKERVQNGEEIDLTPQDPDFFDELIGDNIVDSFPLEIVLNDNEGSELPGNKKYFHNSGYNNILVPDNITDDKERIRYRIAHKRKVRATRNDIITNLLQDKSVVLSDVTRFRGKLNTEPSSQVSRNKNLRKVFRNTLNFVLGVADSTKIIRKKDNTKMAGRGTTGNIFLETNETLDGSKFSVKLNLSKLSEEHADILFEAMLMKHSRGTGGNSALFEDKRVSEGMSAGEVIDSLVLEGTITNQNEAIDPQDHLKSKTLYGKNHIIYYGEHKLDTSNFTDEDRLNFISWAKENKNYIIDKKLLGRGLNRNIKIGKLEGNKGQLYDNFLVDNDIVLTDLKEGRPFHAPVIGYTINFGDKVINDKGKAVDKKIVQSDLQKEKASLIIEKEDKIEEIESSEDKQKIDEEIDRLNFEKDVLEKELKQLIENEETKPVFGRPNLPNESVVVDKTIEATIEESGETVKMDAANARQTLSDRLDEISAFIKCIG